MDEHEHRRPPDPGDHHHDLDKTLALFERLLTVAEKRIGLHFPRIVELLHDLHERDRKWEKMLDGIWVAVIGLLIGALGVIGALGFKAWTTGG